MMGVDYTKRLQEAEAAMKRADVDRQQAAAAMQQTMIDFAGQKRNPLGAYLRANQQQQQQTDVEIKKTSRTAQQQAILNAFNAIGNSIAGYGGIRTQRVNDTPLYRNLERIKQLRQQKIGLQQSYADIIAKSQHQDREMSQQQAAQRYQQADDMYKSAQQQLKSAQDDYRYQQNRDDRLRNQEVNRQLRTSQFRETQDAQQRRLNISQANQESRFLRSQEAIDRREAMRRGENDNKNILVSLDGQSRQNTTLTDGIINAINQYALSNLDTQDTELSRLINAYYRGKDSNDNSLRTIKGNAQYEDLFRYWYSSLSPELQYLVRMKINQDSYKAIKPKSYKPATHSQLDKLFTTKGFKNWEVYAKNYGLDYTED